MSDFLARACRFYWEEHEKVAWTVRMGGFGFGQPSFSQKCSVTLHLSRGGPDSWWWAWEVEADFEGVEYRASGYVQSMEDGKKSCERAVQALARAVLMEFEEREK